MSETQPRDALRVGAKPAVVEPFLRSNPDRFALYPIRDEELWTMYKNAQASSWIAEEVDLSQDFRDFQQLTEGERHFIKQVLAFFAASDGIVNENLLQNFATEVQVTEARFFYGIQIVMENVHTEMYSLLLDTLVVDPAEKTLLFRAMYTVAAVKKKAEWALNWCDASSHTFAERLVAFAVVEGVFFSGSFCAIFWLKHRHPGILPGLCYSNELISRDEGLHCDFACHLSKNLVCPASPQCTGQIVREAVDIEKEFVADSLPVSLVGMNADSMGDYIEFCADRLLVSLGCSKMYGTENPFPWMTLISLQGKSNFFEKRVGEYARNGVGTLQHHVFDLEADF